MPRPLHERNNRNPIKIQNHSAVGAGHAPPAARTKQSQPHQNTKQLCYFCRGRPMCRPAAYMPLSRTGAHTGAPLQGHHGCICRSQTRAGRPSADRRSDDARTNTGIPVREAVRLRPLAARPQSPHASPLILVVFWPNGAGSRKLSLNFKKTFGKSIEKRRRWQYTKAVFIFP